MPPPARTDGYWYNRRCVAVAAAVLCVPILDGMCPAVAAADTASPPPPLPPPEVEFSTREALVEAAFAAMKYLHEQMDDDHSGSVDLVESGGFIKEELSQV